MASEKEPTKNDVGLAYKTAHVDVDIPFIVLADLKHYCYEQRDKIDSEIDILTKALQSDYVYDHNTRKGLSDAITRANREQYEWKRIATSLQVLCWDITNQDSKA